MAAWYTGSKEEWSLESSVLSGYLPVRSERRCRHPPGERQATPLNPEKRWLIWLVWLCSQGKIQVFLQEGVGNCGGLQRKLWKISFPLNLCLAPRPAQIWIRWALPPRGLGWLRALPLCWWSGKHPAALRRVPGRLQSSM